MLVKLFDLGIGPYYHHGYDLDLKGDTQTFLDNILRWQWVKSKITITAIKTKVTFLCLTTGKSKGIIKHVHVNVLPGPFGILKKKHTPFKNGN